jgi:hypothetical protein
MTGAALNDQYGNEAGAFVDSEEFTVRARAFGSATSPGAARAVAYFATDIRFLNASLGTKAQPFEAFFHGLLQRTHGTRSGMGSADMWFRVKDGDGVLVMEMTQRHSGTSRTTPESGTDVARPLQKSLDLGVGYSRFLIELGVETNVQGAYEAEFGNTVNLFIPSVEGVTWEAPPGVGSRQFVPAWARADAPTTTTPEPASLALVAGGALALVVVRRRVRTA